jgi:RNA polymerase sigma factor (sigma-70 family)
LSAFDFAGYYGLMTVTGHDDELLRRYADEKSEDAFAELVRRHLDLVYSAALRQVNGDAHLAQDVAQMVFTELSRKAASLSHRPVLTGWLYTCAHFCAAKAVRTERRRHSREQEAQAMQELLDNHGPEPDWEKVRPVLDQVMVELSEPDREAILMRYFEKRPLGEIGQRLGLSEDAARKRVERGLEKLRAVLARRGLTTSASLAIAISANAVHAAPAGLAAVVTAGAVAGSAAGAGVTATLLKLMTMSKLQIGIVGAVLAGGVAAPLIMESRSQAELRQARAAWKAQGDELTAQVAENERLSNLLAQAADSQQLNSTQSAELLRLRGEVGSLRRQTNQLASLQADNQRLRAAASSAATPRATAQDTTSHELIQKDAWAFLGYADPESAFQSTVWAMNKGDAKTFLNSLSPEGENFKHVQDRSESEVAAENKRELEKVTAYKIVDKETVSDNEVILTVFAQGESHLTKFRLQRIGTEWKLAGPIKGN